MPALGNSDVLEVVLAGGTNIIFPYLCFLIDGSGGGARISAHSARSSQQTTCERPAVLGRGAIGDAILRRVERIHSLHADRLPARVGILIRCKERRREEKYREEEKC